MSNINWRPEKNPGLFLKAIALLGVAFLLAAGYFYVGAAREEALDARPLAVPVSLVPGTIKMPEIQTDIDNRDYEIALHFETTKPSVYQLKCFAATETSPDPCIPRLIDISWKLLEGERVAFKGNDRGTQGQSMIGRQYRQTIGTFRAKKGHHYTLILDVNRDASELNAMNPQVVVQMPFDYGEDHAMAIGIGNLLAVISGLIGITILIGAFAFARVKNR